MMTRKGIRGWWELKATGKQENEEEKARKRSERTGEKSEARGQGGGANREDRGAKAREREKTADWINFFPLDRGVGAKRDAILDQPCMEADWREPRP